MATCLTGTPGTGKTSVAEQLDLPVIDLTKFARERGLGEQKEEFEVDVEAMKEVLREEVEEREENVVIEGHLSHHFSADYCVVLRCEPDELRERLNQRGYSQEKIDENVEAEMLDVILSEAVDFQENIIEIDTTDREPEEVAEEIEKRIENGETGYGEIDWTDYF